MCSTGYRVLIETSSGFEVHVVPCKSWHCEDCRPWRVQQLHELIVSGHPTTFVTLTTNPRIHSDPHEAARDLMRAWRSLRKYLRRHYPAQEIEYLGVWEATKKGWPHLHLAMRMPYVPQRVLSERMYRLATARIVDIRAIRSQNQLAHYLGKDLTKAPAKWKGLKRYFRSRHYQLEAISCPDHLERAANAWAILRLTDRQLLINASHFGLQVQRKGDRITGLEGASDAHVRTLILADLHSRYGDCLPCWLPNLNHAMTQDLVRYHLRTPVPP